MKFRTVCFSPGCIAPGMTLAKPVTDREGKTLLSADTELDLETIDRLIRRGVETVWIQVLDTRDELTIADDLAAAQSRVEKIFRGPGSASRQTLRAAVLQYRLDTTK